MKVALLAASIGTSMLPVAVIVSGLTRTTKTSRHPVRTKHSWENRAAPEGSCEALALYETDTLISIAEEVFYPLQVRAEAVFELGRRGDYEVLSDLLRFLNAPEPEIRNDAVDGMWALAKKGAIDPPLRRGSYKERRAVLLALGQMGAREAVPLLIDVVEANGPDAPIARDAARALALIGDRTAIQYIERAMLRQLITSEKPHKDLLFSCRRLLKTRSYDKFKAIPRSCTKANQEPII